MHLLIFNREIQDEYYLGFIVPENYDKLEFVAEGYYIEHQETKHEIFNDDCGCT